MAEQRRNRIQFRRRNRVETSEDTDDKTDSNVDDVEATVGRRTLTRQRSRFRGQTSSRNTENSEQSTSAPRFANPRRFRSRARSSVSQSQPRDSSAPTNQRLRIRGGSRTRSRVVPEEVREEEELSEQTGVTEESVIDNTDPQEQILEGKSKVEIVSTSTEGDYKVVTELTLNTDEENSEDEDQTEEVSTLRPGKFKPKFGSETREKLREKLRQELLSNKTGSAVQPNHDLHSQFSEVSVDVEFSDFDIDSSVTPALVSIRPEDAPQISSSPGQVRIQRKTSEDDLLRFGRSTIVNEATVTDDSVTQTIIKDDEEFFQPTVKPFLLRGGKGYRKNNVPKNSFSEFRKNLPFGEKQPKEKVSGPNPSFDSGRKVQKIKFAKADDDGSNNVISLDFDYSTPTTTLSPHTLTPSSPRKILKKKTIKRKQKVKKIPKRVTPSSDAFIKTPILKVSY